MKTRYFAFLAVLSAFNLVGCNHTEKNSSVSLGTSNKLVEVKQSKGEFFYYTKNGNEETLYGTAVILNYEKESHKITSVTRDEAVIVEKNFNEVTDLVIEGSFDGTLMKEKYLENVDSVLSTYKDKTYEEVYSEIKDNVKAAYTSTDKKDVVFNINEDYKTKESFIVTTGATLTSARLCIAIANAISNINMLDSLMTIGIDDYSPSGV